MTNAALVAFVVGVPVGGALGVVVAVLYRRELDLYRRARHGGDVDLTGAKPRDAVRRRGNASR